MPLVKMYQPLLNIRKFYLSLLTKTLAPVAEARDNTRGPCVRIRHIPIHSEGDGGLFAPLKNTDTVLVVKLSDTF